ncbi:MAG: DNA-formamidopyrimidine glycosylase family protein [Deltaproteobacteria bacterium]|nr:DNA-formamidopyrimidine glycosylase family protein [Deltaproteobacteria bacterium]
MPELPDVTIYLEALAARVLDQPLEKVRLASPFVLRTVEPPLGAVAGRRVLGLRRLGKRLVFELEDELFLVIHLMVAGRLRWEKRGAKPPGKLGLAAFDFPSGTLLLTEASPKKRAALHVVRGRAALAAHDPGGLEPLQASAGEFAAALRLERHTLKRALTDPHLLSGIGNAYSDEILHAARLSPVQLTSGLDDADLANLYAATQRVLRHWTERLRADFAGRFPAAGEITAFRPDFAVHGKFGQPCPVCATPVQRIRYADNETNYCPTCQTGGRLLADRSLSRLLKQDWPKSLDELEARLDSRRKP